MNPAPHRGNRHPDCCIKGQVGLGEARRVLGWLAGLFYSSSNAANVAAPQMARKYLAGTKPLDSGAFGGDRRRGLSNCLSERSREWFTASNFRPRPRRGL